MAGGAERIIRSLADPTGRDVKPAELAELVTWDVTPTARTRPRLFASLAREVNERAALKSFREADSSRSVG